MPRGEEELLLQGVCPWEQGNKASLGLGVLLWDCWVPAEPAPEQESPSSHPHPAQVPKDPGGTLQGEQGVTNPHSQALKWHHTEMQTLLWTFYPIPKPQGTQATAQGATGLHKYLKEQKAGSV